MAQQEGGWPLGLQPLNVRVGLTRNVDFSGSLSFSTLTTIGGSPSSSASSSDLDTEKNNIEHDRIVYLMQSTASFFHDRSNTLGSLIGITSILELSNKRIRSRGQCGSKARRKNKSKACFSLCSRALPDVGNALSLGHFLEVERRAGNGQRRNGSVPYEIEGLPEIRPDPKPDSLFEDGIVAPPRICRDAKNGASHDGAYWLPLTFSCMRP